METMHLIVQKKPTIEPLLPLIAGSFQDYKITKISSQAILITFSQTIDTNDFEDVYSLWLSDIEEPFKLLFLPYNAFNVLDVKDILIALEALSPKVYYFTEILLHTIQSDYKLKHSIIKKLNKVLIPSLITTLLRLAEADMNMSIAAKKLYIHRNTMLYRIDQIHSLTGIDPKHFEGLLIFYLLFKR